MACADQYFGCPGLREIPKLSFSVKVLFSVFFFFCFKPIYFLTKFCGKKQNLNDSTYVTQNYWALSFFFKDNPHENSIFGLSRFPFQPELLGWYFPFSPFQRGRLLGFFKGLAVLLRVLEECSIAVDPAEPINHDLETPATVPSCLSQTKGNAMPLLFPLRLCSTQRL